MDETTRRAITAARLHYLQNMTMQQVATQLGVSPSKISRLLAWARRQGLVEVRIHDAEVAASELEARMLERFGVRTVVVATPTGTTEPERLDAVARVAAACLSQAVVHGTTLALAWGTTVRAIGGHLRPKAVRDVQIVQLNGSGNTSAALPRVQAGNRSSSVESPNHTSDAESLIWSSSIGCCSCPRKLTGSRFARTS